MMMNEEIRLNDGLREEEKEDWNMITVGRGGSWGDGEFRSWVGQGLRGVNKCKIICGCGE